MWFRRKEYVLVSLKGKEEVETFGRCVSKEEIKEAIDDGEYPPGSYKLVERGRGGDKTIWTLRQKREKSPEELAEKDKEQALKTLEEDAKDIVERVQRHKELQKKVKELYGIDSETDVDGIKIPDKEMGILEAMRRATAESMYVSIRKHPDDVSRNFFAMMESGTKLLSVAADYAAKYVAGMGNKNKKKEKEKETPVEKEEKPEKKTEPEIIEKKEVVDEGVTKITFMEKEEEEEKQNGS